MSRRLRRRLAWVVALVVLVLGAALPSALPAGAHESTPTGVTRVAATLSERDLTLTLVPPSTGTGTLAVGVETLGAPGGPALRVGAEPVEVDAPGDPVPAVDLVPGAAGRPAETALPLERPGRWEVVVDDGTDRARIPLLLTDPATPGWVWAVRVGGALALVCGIAALSGPALRHRVRAVALGGVALTAAAVAVTAAVTAPPAPTTTSTVGGAGSGVPVAMPGMDGMAGMGATGGHAHGAAAPDPAAAHAAGAIVLGARTTTPAVAGVPTTLELAVTDGSTGEPVDDLVVHDEAFIHLAVISPDGSLVHTHPVRTAPGRWSVRFTPAASGRHGVFAEVSRDGGGHVGVRSAIDVAGPPTAPAPPADRGVRQVAGMTVAVTADDAVAGRPTRVGLRATDPTGAPVTDLAPWLGMAGHLLVLGPGTAAAPDPADAASTFAHVHDMRPRTGRGYGPEIGFTYAFPSGGRYRLWLQVVRDGAVVTVPLDLAVAPSPPAV